MAPTPGTSPHLFQRAVLLVETGSSEVCPSFWYGLIADDAARQTVATRAIWRHGNSNLKTGQRPLRGRTAETLAASGGGTGQTFYPAAPTQLRGPSRSYVAAEANRQLY